MIDISKAFGIPSQKISGFFQQPGLGFYIPLYQRAYSWDDENIRQLMEDICRGVQTMLTKEKDTAIRFLGTVILVTETDKNQIQPQDKTALPTRIDKVIDGQQRISTIALLSCVLYQRIEILRHKVPSDPNFDGLKEAIESHLNLLRDVFSVDLNRGVPSRKPIIIRGSQDTWTLNGPDTQYVSSVSSFLAAFIRAVITPRSAFPSISKQTLVGKNLKQMNDALTEVANAHISKTDDFPPAWEILRHVPQDELWLYERPELESIVMQAEQQANLMTSEQKLVCELVQLFAYCYYLLQRCCFTVIEPIKDVWAFDMFQSLNATGTPLTAIETFKPLVMNKAEKLDGNFKGSLSDIALSQVDQLFEPLRSASSKDRLTNEYLTILAVAHNGWKMTNTFSEQRRWLMDEFEKCTTKADREEFVLRMANLAIYWSKITDFKNKDLNNIPGSAIVNDLDRQHAALSLLYLQDSNHKMAHSVLGRYYALVLRKIPNGEQAFVDACKAIAAFYTLWRSASSNAGLDDVYRKTLKDHLSWEECGVALTVDSLKSYLKKSLTDRGLGNKLDWMNKAVNELRYDNVQKVCRFALFVTAHDAVVDPNQLGLMSATLHSGYCNYLSPQQWKSEDLQSIEHIAPQESRGGWDKALYDDDAFERIGNLTLLPIPINSAVSNRGWLEKRAYYRHLAEKNATNLAQLHFGEVALGLDLTQATLDKLHGANHAHHIEPIIALDNASNWDRSLVERRSQRMCDILWDRMFDDWLK